jgi:sortase A
MVLLVVGLIIMLTAITVWALAPLNVPDQLSQSGIPPTLVPAADTPVMVQPGPETKPQESGTGEPSAYSGTNPETVLLPETPPQGPPQGGLPSFATVADAPRFHNESLPGQPVRLVIPTLGIDANVHRVGLMAVEKGGQTNMQWVVPNGYAVGWHETSPPLGEPGNIVLNGHNNIYGEIFRYLADLAIGEEIILYDADGQAFVYHVSQQELMAENDQPLEVRAQNAHWIAPTNDERVTLISCWPYLTNTHRIAVIARPAESVSS